MPFYAAQINSLKVVTLTDEANTAVYTCIPVAFFAVACGAAALALVGLARKSWKLCKKLEREE